MKPLWVHLNILWLVFMKSLRHRENNLQTEERRLGRNQPYWYLEPKLPVFRIETVNFCCSSYPICDFVITVLENAYRFVWVTCWGGIQFVFQRTEPTRRVEITGGSTMLERKTVEHSWLVAYIGNTLFHILFVSIFFWGDFYLKLGE